MKGRESQTPKSPVKLMDLWNNLTRYLYQDLWERPMEYVTGWKRFPHVLAQFIAVTWREVGRDRCNLLAAGLTYTTLISVVPVLAVGLAALKGLNYEDTLLDWAVKNGLPGLPEDYRIKILEATRQMVGNVNGKMLGVLGGVGLFFSVSLFFGNIESAFNGVWKVSQSRQAIRKTIIYVGVLVVAAVLLVAALSLDIVTEVMNRLGNQVGLVVSNILPFLISLAAFVSVYYLVPNTQVRFRSAFLGGLTAAALWTITKFAYVVFQFGVVKANKIYGGLAALPLALAWIYMSWWIVLVGGEVAAISNRGLGSYILPRAELLPFSVKEEATIRLMMQIARSFESGEIPPSAGDLDIRMGLHEGTLVGLLELLEHRGIVRRLAEPPYTFLPARSLDKITISDIREAIRQGLKDITLHRKDRKDETISKILDRMAQGAYEAGGKTSLAELIRSNKHNRSPEET